MKNACEEINDSIYDNLMDELSNVFQTPREMIDITMWDKTAQESFFKRQEEMFEGWKKIKDEKSERYFSNINKRIRKRNDHRYKDRSIKSLNQLYNKEVK